jgi:hypothetical protein
VARRRQLTVTETIDDEAVDVAGFLDAYARLLVTQSRDEGATDGKARTGEDA